MGLSYLYVEPAYDAVDVAATTAHDAIALYGKPVTVKARGDGDLVVTTAKGESRTLAVTDGEEIPLLINAIDATSAVPVRVYVWGR